MRETLERRAEDRGEHGRRRWDHPRRWTLWLCSGMAGVPLVVLPHEMAHFVVARIVGLPAVTLHFASVGFAQGSLFWERIQEGQTQAAELIAPIEAVLWMLIAGPAATLLTAIIGLWVVRRTAIRNPLILSAGLFAALSFVPITGVLEIASTGTLTYGIADERRIALLLGAPVWTSVAVDLLVATVLISGYTGAFAERRKPHPAIPLGLGYLYGLFLLILLGPLLIG